MKMEELFTTIRELKKLVETPTNSNKFYLRALKNLQPLSIHGLLIITHSVYISNIRLNIVYFTTWRS